MTCPFAAAFQMERAALCAADAGLLDGRELRARAAERIPDLVGVVDQVVALCRVQQPSAWRRPEGVGLRDEVPQLSAGRRVVALLQV